MKVLGVDIKVPRKRIIVSAVVAATLLAGSATITAFAITAPNTAVDTSVPSTTSTPASFTSATPTAIPTVTATPTAPVEVPAVVVAPVTPVAPVAGKKAQSNTGSVSVPVEPVWEDAPVYVAPPPIEYETINTKVCETGTAHYPDGTPDMRASATVCRTETTTRPKK